MTERDITVTYRKGDADPVVVTIPAPRDPFEVLGQVEKRMFPEGLDESGWKRLQAYRAREAAKRKAEA